MTGSHANELPRRARGVLAQHRTLRALGLQPTRPESRDTWNHGFDNPNAMLAAAAAGVRQLVSDTSVAGARQSLANAGFCNALVPGILELPRMPTNLFFDVSLPDEWATEYAVLLKTTATYDQMIAKEVEPGGPPFCPAISILDVPPGEHPRLRRRPQPAFGSPGRCSRSLSRGGDLPGLEPDDDGRARDVGAGAMSLDASGVSATISGSQMTVTVKNAGRIPVTGSARKTRSTTEDRPFPTSTSVMWYRPPSRSGDCTVVGGNGRPVVAPAGLPCGASRSSGSGGSAGAGGTGGTGGVARPEALERVARPGRWPGPGGGTGSAGMGDSGGQGEGLPRAGRPERRGPVAAPEGVAGQSPVAAGTRRRHGRKRRGRQGSRARTAWPAAGSAGTTGDAGNTGQMARPPRAART